MLTRTPQRESVEAVKRYRARQALRERLDHFLTMHDAHQPLNADQWSEAAVNAVLAVYRGAADDGR